MFRWLVGDVPQRVDAAVTPRKDPDDAEGSVTIGVNVRDKSYNPQENAAVTIRVTAPDGQFVDFSAQRSMREAGLYEASYVPRQPGAYRAHVNAAAPEGSAVGQVDAGWTSDPAAEEFQQLQPNAALLDRIAHATGGEVEQAADLPAFAATLPRATPRSPKATSSRSGIRAGSSCRLGLPRRRMGPPPHQGAAVKMLKHEDLKGRRTTKAGHCAVLPPHSPAKQFNIKIYKCTLITQAFSTNWRAFVVLRTFITSCFSHRPLAFGLLFLIATVARAADVPATAPDDRPTVIVVQGLDGTPEYGAAFTKSADRWADAAQRANDHFILIGRDALASQPVAASQPTDRQRLQTALESAIRETKEPLWLVFIGHGTFDGHDAKFNLRDTDITDTELATLLRPCVRPLAFIDCSSSSRPLPQQNLHLPLQKPRRHHRHAQTGSEVNFARFGEFFADAIADPKQSADLDKDGQTSILEAFLAASNKVAEFYKSDSRLATEHALLDDNGDGLGIQYDWFDGLRPIKSARDGAPLDGPRAHQWTLVPSPAEQALSPELRQQRNQIELQIEALRQKKSTLSESDYYAQLDTLLLSLAHIYQPQK